MIALASVPVCFAFSSSAGLLAELCAAKAEDFVVYRLRTALKDALLRKSPARIRTKPAGALVAGLQRYPNALAALVISHSPSKYILGMRPFRSAAAGAFCCWEPALMLFL